MVSQGSPRCPCCDARAYAPTRRTLRYPDGSVLSFSHACTHCGFLVDDIARSAATLRGDLGRAIGAAEFPPPGLDPASLGWGLDIYTLRTAATRLGKNVSPLDTEQAHALAHPHSDLFAAARLDPFPRGIEADLSIAILCREEEWEPAREYGQTLCSLGFDVLVVVDRDEFRSPSDIAPAPGGGALRRMDRPLAADFAEQRNAAQHHAGSRWVLQIDADETLDDKLLPNLAGLVTMAERDGIRSIGFSRRNFVDGTLSDVYPDVQYRLNRASVRYNGRVHERPDLLQGWRESFIALTGTIDHHLSAAHVAARSQRYEAIAPGKGRLDEAEELLRPFRD